MTYLFYNKKSSEDNTSWGIKGYDVIRIGQLFQTGHYPNKRIISLAGSLVVEPCHYQVFEGTPISSIVGSYKKSLTKNILNKMGWNPLNLKAKEGLALLNGTQFMSAYAVWSLIISKKLAYFSDLIAVSYTHLTLPTKRIV